MARIVFWSPERGMSGSTHTAIAVSTLMGIAHKTTCLLMQTNFGSKKIESSFTPYDELKASGAFENSNIGVNALIRLVTSNKLDASAIQNYAKPVLKGRLDILYGVNSKDKEGYLQLVNNLPYITRKADEVYELVFVDIPKTTGAEYLRNTLADSEIVVCVVNQDSVKLDDFFNRINTIPEIKDKQKIIVIGDYNAKSKYNVKNIRLRYKVADPIFTLPHNYIFADACNDGAVVDFFYRNINADAKDYNGEFIAQTLQIVEKIAEIAKLRE